MIQCAQISLNLLLLTVCLMILLLAELLLKYKAFQFLVSLLNTFSQHKAGLLEFPVFVLMFGIGSTHGLKLREDHIVYNVSVFLYEAL